MMQSNSQSIAREILNQLGGQRFIAMTGARNFLALESGLQFKLPKFDGLRINTVRIVLTPADTYTVEFGRVYGMKYTILSSHDDVYCDGLRELVESETGLALSL